MRRIRTTLSLLAATSLLTMAACTGASQTPQASLASTSPSSFLPSPSPWPSPAPTDSPQPTAARRDGWQVRIIAKGAPDARVGGIAEARGTLFALGKRDQNHAGIWYSADGLEWSAADVPAAPEPYGFTAQDLVDTGDRLVVLAPGGHAGGGAFLATAIYVSDDGRSWRAVENTPGTDAGPHHALVMSGDRLLAIGTSVWTSQDGGLSWIETTPEVEFDGVAFDAVAAGDLVVAVGQAGVSDVVGPPGLAWISTDGGVTWMRHEIDTAMAASAVAIEAGGHIVVAGGPMIWTSMDQGVNWSAVELGECCINALVATPTGVVALSATGAEPFEVSTSTDGRAWSSADPLSVPVWAAASGPRFGLVAVSDTSVLLGPNPFP